MEEAPILGSSREQKIFNQVIALHGAPAYIRRAQKVQAAWDGIVEQCQRQRNQWLSMVGMRLAVLRALAGEWTSLAAVIPDPAALDPMVTLHREIQPRLRHPVQPTTSQRLLRAAFRELIQSLKYFNQRWGAYLVGIDLTEVNSLREDYNRYYVLEKECAVRSPMIARQGFQRLPPATLQDLQALFPPLCELNGLK
jgi:hypothetical protein